MKAILAVAVAAVLGGCAANTGTITSAPPAGATEAGLVAAGEDWNRLKAAEDWAAFRALFADDAVLMVDDAPKISGADDIVAYLRRAHDAGAQVTLEMDNEEVVADYPYGFVTTKYAMEIAFPGRDPIIQTGRALLIYKWQDGGWKLWRDMDNSTPDAQP